MTREGILHGILLVVLTAVTGYLAWQIGVLATRQGALERESIALREKLAADDGKIAEELARVREALAARDSPPAPAAAEPTAAEPKATPAASDATPAHFRFLETHLVPSDAAIAESLYLAVPLDGISRQTNHSRGFVIVRGSQIERALSAEPKTPPELLTRIRASLERIKAER
jgi:hypothetical protein